MTLPKFHGTVAVKIFFIWAINILAPTPFFFEEIGSKWLFSSKRLLIPALEIVRMREPVLKKFESHHCL